MNTNIINVIETEQNSQTKNNTFGFSNSFNNIVPLSPYNRSNISYYQNNSYSSPYINNSLSYKGNESFYSEELYQGYNLSHSPENEQTPKMFMDIEQNDDFCKKKENDKEIIKKNIQLNVNNTNSITKISTLNLGNQIEKIPIPIIQNIVSTADLCCEMNLKEIALRAQNTIYNPKRFSGLIMRIKDPKTTALIFSNGKIVCLGAKTEEESEKACRKYGKILKNMNYPVKFKNFKIQNIVSSCRLDFEIPLVRLYIHMKKYLPNSTVNYEPELFPGLIYRYMNKKKENDNQSLNIVYLIFKSGNIVIAGAKNRHQIFDSFENVFTLLSQFKSKS